MKEDDLPFDLAKTIACMRAAGTDLQSCEVKSAVGKLPKDLAESVSAFSNGSGGTIVLGLSEEEGFKPAPGFDAKRAQDALAEACSTKLTPAIRPNMNIETFEGAPVLVASIPELPPRDKPCHVTTRGAYEGSFIRTGDGDRKLSHYEIDRLIEEHSQPRHDARIVEGAAEDDLDDALVEALVERERFLHPRIFEKLEKRDILKALRVLDEDEDGVLRPTLAGLLALGFYPQKHFPRLSVSFAAYPGTTKATLPETGQRFLDSNDFVGPIPVMIAEAVAAVAKKHANRLVFRRGISRRRARLSSGSGTGGRRERTHASRLLSGSLGRPSAGQHVRRPARDPQSRRPVWKRDRRYAGNARVVLKSKRIFVQNTRKHPIRSSTRESALCRGEQRVGICGNRNAAGGRIHGAAEAP